MVITKAQRQALCRIWNRTLHFDTPSTLTYRQFRRTAQYSLCCDNAVLVPYAGMWLGIEKDGYCHS